MNSLYPIFVGAICLIIGITLGYHARQSIAKKRAGTIEAKINQKILKAKDEISRIKKQAEAKASEILTKARNKEEAQRTELLRTEKLLLKRGVVLDEKFTILDQKEEELRVKIGKLRQIKENLQELEQGAKKQLEKMAGLSKEQAKQELFKNLETEHQKEILGKIQKLKKEGWERFDKKAKELLATAIQKLAVSQVQELTTTTVSLPDDNIKGRIIGKEGRNIRTLEKLTGTDILIDDTPGVVVISAYDSVRRHIAKIALEKLIHDGRIQPARIESEVEKAQEEIATEIKEAGEVAVFETGIIELDPKLVKLLGRLKFRTSYGQNVLLHSIEVSHLAGALAAEIGGDIKVAKKAGLLHDIGKAIDHQVEGSHTTIGMKVLEKFDMESKIIQAMKSHHEEYPAETLEAVLVTVADAISGARPGARKDTLENYLKRIEELEKFAQSFNGVEKAWALQAGREIRVFVKPEEIDDLRAHQLAKKVSAQIEEELKYPGEIKVTVIREKRIVEYAK